MVVRPGQPSLSVNFNAGFEFAVPLARDICSGKNKRFPMAKRKSKVSPVEQALPRIIELLKEENELLDEVSPDVFARGEDYFKRGAVSSLRIGEDRVTARVDGTERYEVTI